MASNYSITDSEVAQVHVEAAPTILSGTPLANKQVFDKFAALIRTKFNAFVEHAESTYLTSTSATIEISKKQMPVGYVVTNTTNTNPATYLGFGTWVQLGNMQLVLQRLGQDNAVKTLYYWERFE